MKKYIALMLSLMMLVSMMGCAKKNEVKGDTTIQIDEVVYYNTKEIIPLELDESLIHYVEPSDQNTTNDKIDGYAFINEDTLEGEMLVGRIDGKWYQFLPKEVTPKAKQ